VSLIAFISLFSIEHIFHRSISSSRQITQKIWHREKSSWTFYFIWLEQIENIYVDIFVCIEIPWGHCRCDMLIVCIQKKFNWKIFVLFRTACNFIMLHIFFYCLTNGNHRTCVFRLNTANDMMVEWFYSIRNKNTSKYQNIFQFEINLENTHRLSIHIWPNHFLFSSHYLVKKNLFSYGVYQ
jgi:hypothetical protein